MNSEKIKKGLVCCMKWTGEPDTATCHCSDCSYTNMDIFGQRCLIDLINDALELIEELEERVAIMEENRRWISTDDRMPMVGKPVFGAVYGSDIVILNEGETVIDALRRTKDDNPHTVTCVWYGQAEGWWSDGGLMIVEPRYWMPIDIPVPPDPDDMQ